MEQNSEEIKAIRSKKEIDDDYQITCAHIGHAVREINILNARIKSLCEKQDALNKEHDLLPKEEIKAVIPEVVA